ncbi:MULTISPECIES: TrmH family RNA methyltransferase [Bizionia]|uniref:RNA methyltransferase n=1 Tax=Bizionia algoritergicola TaxID=291187 RepID=A0A5D0QWC6_9FLAO|nr:MULTISPECIES: RNA methyltransferase [Bizionia]OBX19302.1 RNA methyltransferase [Bizionia sp. APA-3]TYB72981.1 RNA methyltransferase [Bizionia algoritergicola]
MLSKNQIKLVTSLKQKKYRQQHGLFVAEGVKTIQELLNSNLELQHVYAVSTFNLDSELETLITEKDLKKISSLKTPNQALAVFKIPKAEKLPNNGFILALDDIRDPGNLGTIIRLCDWFGIQNLVCSEQTVDCYNPKVIQATMGSITRVHVNYTDLNTYLSATKSPIYGAFMDGDNVYKEALIPEGVLVMGNEANGISEAIEKQITKRVCIPRFGSIQATESLNVATATAILLSEFKRG